jgi:hypothetical protein
MSKKKPHYHDDPQLTLNVSYGDVSVGDKTARIPVKVDRGSITIAKVDERICDKRLTGEIVRRPDGEANGQGRLPGMEGMGIQQLKGVFDVKGFSVTKKHIAFGLTFAIASIDIGDLVQFAKRTGQLVIKASEAIPEAQDAEGESDE